MELSCPLGTTRRVPQEEFPRKPYNKSFIDQACSVKMAGYWPRSSFASLWTSTPSRSINMQKKELGQYPAILTEQAWSITHISCVQTICRMTTDRMSVMHTWRIARTSWPFARIVTISWVIYRNEPIRSRVYCPHILWYQVWNGLILSLIWSDIVWHGYDIMVTWPN